MAKNNSNLRSRVVGGIAGITMGLYSVLGLSCSNPAGSDPIPVEVSLTEGSLDEILNDGFVDVRSDKILNNIVISGDYSTINWTQGNKAGVATYDSASSTIAILGDDLAYGDFNLVVGDTEISGLTYGPNNSVFYANSSKFNTAYGSESNMRPGVISSSDVYTQVEKEEMFSAHSEALELILQGETKKIGYGTNTLRNEEILYIRQDVSDASKYIVFSLPAEGSGSFEDIESKNPYNIDLDDYF